MKSGHVEVCLLYRSFFQCVVAPEVVSVNIHTNIDSDSAPGERVALSAWIGWMSELFRADTKTDTQDDEAESYTNKRCRLSDTQQSVYD